METTVVKEIREIGWEQEGIGGAGRLFFIADGNDQEERENPMMQGRG